MSNTATFTVDGTAALKAEASSTVAKTAHIISFPRMAETATPVHGGAALPSKASQLLAILRTALQRAFDSSEMYCSLKFEDFRGVAYGVFSKANIRALAVSSCIVAVLAIAFGA